MKLDYLIHILNNKILSLQQQKHIAETNGNLEAVLKIDEEIQETQSTLTKLIS
jgi:hypothetical protein